MSRTVYGSEWEAPTAVQRQAAAAQMWMEMTGRTVTASAPAEKTADAPNPTTDQITRPMRRGAVAGGIAGAALGARAAHSSGVGGIMTAALGGGAVGAATGGAVGGAYGTGRVVERSHPAVKVGSGPSMYSRLVEYLAERPGTRHAVGAAAVGIPLGAYGYLRARNAHKPGTSGTSEASIRAGHDLQAHRDQAANRGATSPDLVERYLKVRHEALGEAAKHPVLSALAGSSPYAIAGGLTGASLASRILRK